MRAVGPELAPAGPGRRYAATQTVCLGDVLPSGEVRLDALARYLQDVAGDDGRDAAIDEDRTWVVRKVAMAIVGRPVFGQRLELVTWASGAGGRWAERRTSIRAAGPESREVGVEVAALWVCMDPATGRPAKLTARFWEMYGEAVGGRTVSPRLAHHDPPAALAVGSRPWPLRVADIDVFDHVNNAATWTAVDDELQRGAPGRPVEWAELEYRSAIEPDAELRLASVFDAGEARMWLVAPEGAQASAVLRFG